MFLFHRFAHLFRSRGFEIEAGEPVSFNFYSSSASDFERLAAAEMAQQLHMLIRWLRGKTPGSLRAAVGLKCEE